MNANRVPPKQRRRRLPTSGLFWSQYQAISSLPEELRPVVASLAVSQTCVETTDLVRRLKRLTTYAAVSTPEIVVRAPAGSPLHGRPWQEVIQLGGLDRIEVTLPVGPESGRVCDTCMTVYRPRRRDARYCSGRCRQLAYRRRQKPTPGTT